jgi:protocatechuate 3,4-dioxygenase beta subunit
MVGRPPAISPSRASCRAGILFWPLTRPRHIHLIVTRPDCESLTTQIYFDGDKYNRWDPWWRPSLTIRLEPGVIAGSDRVSRRGVFDIT